MGGWVGEAREVGVSFFFLDWYPIVSTPALDAALLFLAWHKRERNMTYQNQSTTVFSPAALRAWRSFFEAKPPGEFSSFVWQNWPLMQRDPPASKSNWVWPWHGSNHKTRFIPPSVPLFLFFPFSPYLLLCIRDASSIRNRLLQGNNDQLGSLTNLTKEEKNVIRSSTEICVFTLLSLVRQAHQTPPLTMKIIVLGAIELCLIADDMYHTYHHSWSSHTYCRHNTQENWLDVFFGGACLFLVFLYVIRPPFLPPLDCSIDDFFLCHMPQKRNPKKKKKKIVRSVERVGEWGVTE